MGKLDVTTTNKEIFTEDQSAELALMIYIRFGRNVLDAAMAWRRLLQNTCEIGQFAELVLTGEKLAAADLQAVETLAAAAGPETRWATLSNG